MGRIPPALVCLARGWRGDIEHSVPELAWCYLGRVGFAGARRLQTRLVAERVSGRVPDLLLLLEHHPVLTVGRHAQPPVLEGLVPPIVRTDRGGGLTYHGPGQIVAYPVLALRSGGRGIRWLVAAIEQAMCDTAATYEVPAHVRPGLPGIWARGSGEAVKLGSIGLAVRRGVTLHGCALNLSRQAEIGFAGIVPCGLPGVQVSSLETERGRPVPSTPEVAPVLARALANRLHYPESARLQGAATIAGVPLDGLDER
jgi:lipoyl(octanoyl) transferase